MIRTSRQGLLPYTHFATVLVDGREVGDWAFYLQPLGDHWVTVARGPPSDIVDAYGEFTRTLERTHFDSDLWKRELRAPHDGFTIVGIR